MTSLLQSGPPTVLYTAAHGGFAGQPAALGGGAAVAEHLVEEWSRTRPFDLVPVTPPVLGTDAPTARQLIEYSGAEYARFARAFERAATEEILRHDPARTVVLSNDVAEGPDFRGLARWGYAVYTILHVDVVDYVAAIYARGLLRPETLIRLYDRLRWAPLPRILELIFRKQRDAVECSRGLIVPSAAMRDVLERCYPSTPPERIHVLPWGTWADEPDHAKAAADARALRQEYGLDPATPCLLTLSRLSPEKGQDLLLAALDEWTGPPLEVFVCGEAAFMQGRRYADRLRTLAARLETARVHFPGYVTGARKRAFFAMADLFVFPSRHESYGLTLMEALRAGLPAVCLDHHGAREVMRGDFGAIVPAPSRRAAITGLRRAIERLVADPAARRAMGEAARRYAASQPFSHAAARLAGLLTREGTDRRR